MYGEWRQNLVKKVDDRDPAYLRPTTFDAVLCVLFPGMARRIPHGSGRVVDE